MLTDVQRLVFSIPSRRRHRREDVVTTKDEPFSPECCYVQMGDAYHMTKLSSAEHSSLGICLVQAHSHPQCMLKASVLPRPTFPKSPTQPDTLCLGSLQIVRIATFRTISRMNQRVSHFPMRSRTNDSSLPVRASACRDNRVRLLPLRESSRSRHWRYQSLSMVVNL